MPAILENKSRVKLLQYIPRMRTFAVTLLVFSISACASPDLREAASLKEQVTQIQNDKPASDKAAPVEQDKIYADQIPSANLEIDQLGLDNADHSLQIGTVPGADPCYWARREGTPCNRADSLRSDAQPASRVSTEVELNIMNVGRTTNAFDVEKTVDEIGRGRATTESAKAIGNDFLNPLPDKPDEAPDHLEDSHPETSYDHTQNASGL